METLVFTQRPLRTGIFFVMLVEAPLDLTFRQEKNENLRVTINFAV